MSVAPATSTTTPVSTKWTLLPLPKTESPIEFFELLGVVCGAAVIVYLGWILKGRLRARRLRARVSCSPTHTIRFVQSFRTILTLTKARLFTFNCSSFLFRLPLGTFHLDTQLRGEVVCDRHQIRGAVE